MPTKKFLEDGRTVYALVPHEAATINGALGAPGSAPSSDVDVERYTSARIVVKSAGADVNVDLDGRLDDGSTFLIGQTIKGDTGSSDVFDLRGVKTVRMVARNANSTTSQSVNCVLLVGL